MKYNIITIEREYASGGRKIGKNAAKKLNIPYYGKEILEIAAMRNNIPKQHFERMEETVSNSLIYSIYMMSSVMSGKVNNLPETESLNIEESKIISELAYNGPCIIIGHCAGHVLRDRNDVLNVFIHADWEVRKKRAIEKYGIEKSKAESVLKKYDKRRANYYTANTNKRWNDISNYHLVLDSGKLGIDKCVDIITSCLS